MTPFRKAVFEIVRRIPPGKVFSYGEVAAMAGQPRAARGVGWILHQTGHDSDLPWWRVVNRKGGISTYKLPGGTGPLQRELLEKEGVAFDEDGRVAGDNVWWKPGPEDDPD